MKGFSKFLEKLIDFRARNLMNANTSKKNINMLNMTGNDEFSTDSTPTVFISAEEDKFGFITGINLAAASLFGYNKTELIS